jgi:hypothetical protein
VRLIMNRESTPIPEPVAQLQHQLEQFRSTQPGRTKLPESLWQAAVELARQHGVYPVAHPLQQCWGADVIYSRPQGSDGAKQIQLAGPGQNLGDKSQERTK